jgi:uncharacterized membrane protein YecN with MAPEG domain
MAFVTVIVMLALVEYMYFGAAVGRARARHDVAAPATHGDETFERFFRAHQNTLEQIVVFIPAIYAAGYYANELFAVATGVVFLIGRALYFRSYIRDPQARGIGMIVTMISVVVLVIAGLVGAVRAAL